MIKTHYVLGFAFNNELDHVALIKKSRPKWQAGKWNGIGGHLGAEESPSFAMTREFLEETGHHSSTDDWKRFAIFKGEEFYIHVFVARLNSTPALEKMTDETPCWCGTRYLPSDVIPNLRWLVPMAREVLITKEFSHYEIFRR